MKYLHVMLTTWRSRLAYFWDVVASSLFLAVILFVFVQLWRITLGGDGKAIEGFTLEKMIWYYVATETIVMSLIPIHRQIEREVREGDVAVRLNKPYSYLTFHFASTLAEGLFKSVLLIAIGSALTLWLVGPLAFDFSAVPALLVVYVVTMALNFAYSALIGLSAFWTEDVTGLFFVMDRAKWLLGGFLLPISLFPEPLKSWAQALPFHLMIYAPARLAVEFTWTGWLELLARQGALLLVLGGAASVIYALGVRRLNLNGG